MLEYIKKINKLTHFYNCISIAIAFNNYFLINSGHFLYLLISRSWKDSKCQLNDLIIECKLFTFAHL